MIRIWRVVYDDGTRPYGAGIPVDQRRPLEMTVGETTTIRVTLINPVGGVVLLRAGEFLQLTARAARRGRQLFTARSVADADEQVIAMAASVTSGMIAQTGTFDLWSIRGAERSALIPVSEFVLAPQAVGNNFQ